MTSVWCLLGRSAWHDMQQKLTGAQGVIPYRMCYVLQGGQNSPVMSVPLECEYAHAQGGSPSWA